MACEFCDAPKLCSGGVCTSLEEAEGCARSPLAHPRIEGVLTVALAGADQADAAWREKELPMDRTHSRRRMLHPSPPRRFGLPSERIYFAHPMPDYDTLREREAIRAIEDHFGPEFDVVNPNHPDHRAGYAAGGRDFKYWTDLAASCGRVVYMSLPEGWIGSGVWKEVDEALRQGRWAYEIGRDLGAIVRVRHLDVSRCLPVDETRRTTHMILSYRRDYANG